MANKYLYKSCCLTCAQDKWPARGALAISAMHIVVADPKDADLFTLVFFFDKFDAVRRPNKKDLKYLERILQACPDILECRQSPILTYHARLKRSIKQGCVSIRNL